MNAFDLSLIVLAAVVSSEILSLAALLYFGCKFGWRFFMAAVNESR